MAQNRKIGFDSIEYSRADYTALRAFCLKVAPEKIATLYYSEDSPQVLAGIESFLIGMRHDLIERAIEHNPRFAESLATARKGGAISTAMLDILVKAADVKRPIPSPTDELSKWFRPKLVRALKSEEIKTINDLKLLIERRGAGWWRSVPRIGVIRSKVIYGWLRGHARTIGAVVELIETPVEKKLVLVTPDRPGEFARLGSFRVHHSLDGSAGINRSMSFCFIQAKNDLEALEFYLSRFIGRDHTYRAYRKELERFLLWSVMVAKKPMSSLLVNDCQNYMKFLSDPSPEFKGGKAKRYTKQWKPFSNEPMEPRSQKHAITIIRAAFDYLVGVRYLSGNPWIAVVEPPVVKKMTPIDVSKALDEDVWDRLISKCQIIASEPAESQMRIALAAMLLLGDSGLRRFECVGARRNALKRSSFDAEMFELTIIGKRSKERMVPVSPRAIQALQMHWEDKEKDFTNNSNNSFLISALLQCNANSEMELDLADRPLTEDGLYKIIAAAIKKVVRHEDHGADFTVDEVTKLLSTSPHAFRHTFCTVAMENDVPYDVVQEIAGHESIDTTRLYSKTKQKRVIRESAALNAKLSAKRTLEPVS